MTDEAPVRAFIGFPETKGLYIVCPECGEVGTARVIGSRFASGSIETGGSGDMSYLCHNGCRFRIRFTYGGVEYHVLQHADDMEENDVSAWPIPENIE
jgi:hypothetical protein